VGATILPLQAAGGATRLDELLPWNIAQPPLQKAA
jgi:hypothetical protein